MVVFLTFFVLISISSQHFSYHDYVWPLILNIYKIYNIFYFSTQYIFYVFLGVFKHHIQHF
jgi:hypothetical protein